MTRILLTGATSGIGLAAATQLAASPHDLLVHGPMPEEHVAAALTGIRRAAHPDTRITYTQADFTNPDGARQLADAVIASVSGLDVLINNAAVPGPRTLRVSPAGTELAYQVNFLAGAMLTHLLLPALDPNGRIVNVASATHYGALLDLDDLAFRRRAYTPSSAYAQSKLAIVTYSNWLAARVPQTVLSIHPGVVSTGLLHAMFGPGGTPATVGGANLVNAVTTPAASGSYLDEQAATAPAGASLDPQLQLDLVADTERRLAVDLP